MPGPPPDPTGQPDVPDVPATSGSSGSSGASDALAIGGGRGLRAGLTVLGALALLGVAVLGVWLVLGNDDDEDQPSRRADPTSQAPTPAPGEASSSLDVPTIDPSDFPTDLPTVGSATDVPVLPNAPQDLPSAFPDLTEIPTDPAEVDSWFSDYLQEMQP